MADESAAGEQLTGERLTLRRTLHERGLRMTPQRQLVLDAVRALRHATPEQVCQRVQQTTPTVNITGLSASCSGFILRKALIIASRNSVGSKSFERWECFFDIYCPVEEGMESCSAIGPSARTGK